ncbi:MAG: hypothetical protein K5876_01445 [Ruminiclostridium sp.]|nr:hypothetical protein [Ruminiclostridium sp.]
MYEIAGICAAAVIMAGIYARTAHPRLYAFFNIAAGAVSLVASEIYFAGSAAGITPYSAALSVILGVPGTALHYFIGMM